MRPINPRNRAAAFSLCGNLLVSDDAAYGKGLKMTAISEFNAAANADTGSGHQVQKGL